MCQEYHEELREAMNRISELERVVVALYDIIRLSCKKVEPLESLNCTYDKLAEIQLAANELEKKRDTTILSGLPSSNKTPGFWPGAL